MTSMSPRTPSCRIVASARLFETAVTPSDCSIEKATISEYDGSLPTSVMSVPCSVVTTLSARPAPATRTCGARKRGGRVRDRVVCVHDVEPELARDLDELVRQRQQVLRLAEQRIARRLDLVKMTGPDGTPPA